MNSGVATPSGSTPSGGTAVRALATSKNGRYLYSVQLSGDATAYSIDATTGKLTAIDSGTIPAGATPVAIAADPSNRFAYVLNHDDSTVTPYRIDATTGRLTANGNAVPTVAQMLSMTIDPTGRNLYVVGSGQLQAFSIDVESGALNTPVIDNGNDSVKALEYVATQVVVEPGGKNLYVVSPDKSIEIYPIDAQTGALGTAHVQPLDRAANSLSIDPIGRFLYTADWVRASVSLFSIDQQNGALVARGQTPLLGDDPSYVAADFSGKFLYAALFLNTDALATLSIDQTTGSLTFEPSNPSAGVGTLLDTVTTSDVQ